VSTGTGIEWTEATLGQTAMSKVQCLNQCGVKVPLSPRHPLIQIQIVLRTVATRAGRNDVRADGSTALGNGHKMVPRTRCRGAVCAAPVKLIENFSLGGNWYGINSALPSVSVLPATRPEVGIGCVPPSRVGVLMDAAQASMAVSDPRAAHAAPSQAENLHLPTGDKRGAVVSLDVATSTDVFAAIDAGAVTREFGKRQASSAFSARLHTDILHGLAAVAA
jgi:hypothetical protein